MQREKVEQANGLNLTRSIGGKPYVLGTRRPRGDFQGTRQTPGVADVLLFLPPPPLRPHVIGWTFVCWEAKAQGGTLSDAQKEFRRLCGLAGVAHIEGTLDALIAFYISGGWLHPERVAHYRQPNGGTDG